MSVAWAIARRELRGGLKGFATFLACLALGVAAIAAVGSVRTSISAGLEREGASLLGGDASVALTYRFAERDERAALDALGEVSEIVDFRSMAVFGDDRGLTQVKGVDSSYPLYGTVTLDPDIALETALAGTTQKPGAVMDPILVDRLGMEVGQTFRLGSQDFVLMARLQAEPDDAGDSFGLGPRIIVQTAALGDSGLLAPGTLFSTQYRVAAPQADIAMLAAAVDAAVDGGRVEDRRNGAPGVAEFVDRLGAFLVLVGLAGLAVGGVGVSAAVRSYLDQKTAVIATLKTLGASRSVVFQTYFFQVGILSALGIAAGLVLGALLPVVFAPLIEARLPVPAVFTVHIAPLAEAALYGFLSAALFTLWPLGRAMDIRPAQLFRDNFSFAGGRFPVVILLVLAALLGLLVASAALLSGMATLTLWAAVGTMAAFATLSIVARGIRALAGRLARAGALRRATTLRMALGAVGGPGSEAMPVVLSLGLGLTVLAAVGQIDTNLRSAIAQDLPEVAPSFFVVDIQNDQLEGFRDRILGLEAVQDIQSAPMLRGVITQINGRPAAEVAGDHWVIGEDRGITYSAAKPDDTTLTQGTWWPEDYTGAPQVSFAAEEAMEMGLRLGDMLTINVLGRDIEARISSFREVDFSTAGIGFILSLNPAALAGAPHTHIATIYADEAAEGTILREIGIAYPNITAIGVRDAIERITGVLGGIAAAITYGAMATLVTGVVVLIGTAAAAERARVYEAAVLKTLGASRRSILVNFALRSALFGLAAGLVAVFAGGLAGWAVSITK
ncbi:MAG: FtsX-like permease family protein, partial [Pseudomonadota bacterium]